mgnify:CR=1 FL=1
MNDNLVVTFNAGSSSLRCGVYCLAEDTPERAYSISIRGLPRQMTLEVVDHDANTTHESELPAPGDTPHEDAFAAVMDHLEDLIDMAHLRAASHRVVHGGQEFTSPAPVTTDLVNRLDSLSPLAPSHQPHNLRPIRQLAERYPDLAQVACFDTAFHRSQPRLAQLYALPRDLSEDGILRFGFHGLSYEHIAETLKRDYPHLHAGRTIVAHLGHGVSLCALDQGRSVATTMGLTALEGMPMGQRCGSLDPGAVLHMILDRGIAPDELRDMLYQQSGLLGVSGISGEMADLLASDAAEAAEAVSLFVYRFRREVGSLTAALGGIDGLVLTGGMGEHMPELRQRLCEAVEWQGGKLDARANRADGPVISATDSRFKILMLPTDEENILARAAIDLI